MGDIILGIWDGHDAGAAFIKDKEILFAANEERFTRRKAEIKFPFHSIMKGIEYLNLDIKEIKHIAYSTTDFSKTLTRCFPILKEKYYMLRRRKSAYPIFLSAQKHIKYFLTTIKSNLITRRLSDKYVRDKLLKMGFQSFELHSFDHHFCHASSAAFCSGFDEMIVLTLDGIGDGYSGSYWIFKNGKFLGKNYYGSRSSFGFFFEYITALLNMRELEDEGKVMALADFAANFPDENNLLNDLINIDGDKVTFRYSPNKMQNVLRKLFWKYPFEHFAKMAQNTLENKICELVRNIIKKYNIRNIAFAGGVASNVKLNKKIKEIPECENLFVFPHMGDGGLAVGAALAYNHYYNRASFYKYDNILLGNGYPIDNIESILKDKQVHYSKPKDLIGIIADLLAKKEIILWYQGRMEYGPRALGARSIIALPNSLFLKDLLNLKLKKRTWYQPFCPSILKEDAKRILKNYDSFNPNMTMAYNINEDYLDKLVGVVNIDKTCRPQIVTKNYGKFYDLLKIIKERTGIGAVLNTSFNIHGEPLVESPHDAIEVLLKYDFNYLVLQDFLVTKEKG